MSATATKKESAATSEAINELFHEAMRSYEKALKSGIQLQEESVNLWKDLLTKLGSPEERLFLQGSTRFVDRIGDYIRSNDSESNLRHFHRYYP